MRRRVPKCPNCNGLRRRAANFSFPHAAGSPHVGLQLDEKGASKAGKQVYGLPSPIDPSCVKHRMLLCFAYSAVRKVKRKEGLR